MGGLYTANGMAKSNRYLVVTPSLLLQKSSVNKRHRTHRQSSNCIDGDRWCRCRCYCCYLRRSRRYDWWWWWWHRWWRWYYLRSYPSPPPIFSPPPLSPLTPLTHPAPLSVWIPEWMGPLLRPLNHSTSTRKLPVKITVYKR